MKTTAEQDRRMAEMSFAAVYPHYVKKVESKGRTIEELHQVIGWLTGFKEEELQEVISSGINFEALFERAHIHANAEKITGLICGYRVEEIENPLTRKVRYLDKLVDELAKGKSMDKILR